MVGDMDSNGDSSAGGSPIFIVGAPRSGTTMMRLILNAHPNIAIPAETSYFPDIYWPCAARGAMAWPEALRSFISTCESRFRPAIDLKDVGSQISSGECDFGALLSLPLTAWANTQGKRRWGEKTPLHIFYADIIVRLFPNARIIAMQRDPRAVVASMNRFAAAGHDTALNSRLWSDVWTKGREILHNSVAEDQRLTVCYEDMVQDPEQVIGEVCLFLGEDFSPSMLSFGESASDYLSTLHSTMISQPIRENTTKWRRELDDRQLAEVERICNSPMEALGYPREGRSLHAREMANVAVKLAYVRYKQWRRRADRYRSVTYRPFGRLRV